MSQKRTLQCLKRPFNSLENGTRNKIKVCFRILNDRHCNFSIPFVLGHPVENKKKNWLTLGIVKKKISQKMNKILDYLSLICYCNYRLLKFLDPIESLWVAYICIMTNFTFLARRLSVRIMVFKT